MKRLFIMAAGVLLAAGAYAQGNNTGMGGNDGNYESLAERVLKLEKKTDAFNVYFNYAASFQELYDGEHWTSSFKNKQARIEIKGNITDKLSYRFRHRLNKSNTAQSQDNFAKATDILMVGYQLTDKLGIQGGKMCQNWGGFEFDENPMYIYQYSDMVDNMDNFMAGVNLSYKFLPTQELNINITDANNGSFNDEYGDDPSTLEADGTVKHLEKANHPLTYIGLWVGSFFNDKLQTRWSYGLQTQAEHKYSRMVVLGQKLNLPTFQWYFDYMGAFDGMDRLGIATNEASAFLVNAANPGDAPTRFADVHYNSFITKVNWQFAPQWNVMVKGAYETASVEKVEELKNFRKSFMYIASVEYYPVKAQDFRVFLSYCGRKFDYSAKSGIDDYNTNRIELGFMYRIKCF